ncbi:MAG TPA: glycine cleavage system protein GcvH [Acidimicrobiia bacterium]|nr:glycine cleavage system protein GcvH [Acidimicrobiia bacterium]
MNFPDDLKYSKEHEWVRVDGTSAVVGITSFAQDSLGDIVYVQLPDVGETLARDQTCAEVESTKSVSDIYAPVAGTVTAVNEALVNTPELVNAEPYGDGWIFRLELSDPGDLDTLMDAAAYRALVEA